MDDQLKYLIHARIVADGVVERTDVVGAVFGQTEGLLGDELEIRGLQESAKLGRIDVEIETENGQSFGTLTIGSGLDKVETAILAAALETIEQVGPCTADIEITGLEDVRAAKRREVVERAKELLVAGFDDSSLSSSEIIEEVRQSTQPGTLTEYRGLPAGSAVETSDAVILVEGRADVRRLVEAGINNVVAIEGTNVPDVIVDLTADRTTTAFLDGDRGGDLILRELAQVADIDQVARAPRGHSVEDLSREEVARVLREKEPLETALSRLDEPGDQPPPARTDGSTTTEPAPTETAPSPVDTDDANDNTTDTLESVAATEDAASETDETEDTTEPAGEQQSSDSDATAVQSHAATVIGEGTGRARLLTATGDTLAEVAVENLESLLEDASTDATVLIADTTADQALADLAITADIDRIVAHDRGAFVKQPATVRIHTNEEVQASELPPETQE